MSLLNVYSVIGVVLVLVGIIAFALPIIPGLVYSVYPSAYEHELDSLTEEIHREPELIIAENSENEEQEGPLIAQFPQQDLSLTAFPQIRIPAIGVSGTLQQGTDANTALSAGPWLVPDMGNPMDNYLPVIIASHRWGGIGWSSDQRETLSFNKLPDLSQGDKIEVIWDQRVFEYEVTRVVESTYIDDYNSDLILYTCKYLWQNPTRIFVYAERSN